MSSTRKIMLKSSDGEAFVVDEAVVLASQTIKHSIEVDDSFDSAIPLANVTSKILSKVIEYCEKHVETPKAEERADGAPVPHATTNDDDLKTWDAEFVKVDRDTLFDIILAANYLNIRSLMDLTCQSVADMIRGQTIEEIRKIFNIKSDYTPEEEAQIRKDNPWDFDPTYFN